MDARAQIEGRGAGTERDKDTRNGLAEGPQLAVFNAMGADGGRGGSMGMKECFVVQRPSVVTATSAVVCCIFTPPVRRIRSLARASVELGRFDSVRW